MSPGNGKLDDDRELLDELAEADRKLDSRLSYVPEDLDAGALESPIDQRPTASWQIDNEYDAMVWGFRVAELRARAAWAAEMAKQIAREARAAEERLIFAVGGRRFREGDKERIGYGLVEEWVRTHLPRGKKSLKTPAGTFAFRSAPSMLHVPEGKEQALLEWCRKNAPHWIKTTETLQVAAIKEHVEQTGEVPADDNGEHLVEYFAADRRDTFAFTPADGAAVVPLGTANRPQLKESVS